jgi:uncharacterized protein YjiS (DUF1127 family)
MGAALSLQWIGTRLSKLVANYRDWQESRNELAYLSDADVALLSADCGLSPGQFREVLKRGPHAADELLALMKELRIDETKFRSVDRAAFNDMKLICAECGLKAVCRRHLRRGTAAEEFQTFCNNAEYLAAATPVLS